MVAGMRVSGKHGEYTTTEGERKSRQRLYGYVMDSSGNNKYLVRFGNNMVKHWKHSLTAALFVGALLTTTSSNRVTSNIFEQLPFYNTSDIISTCVDIISFVNY